LISDLSNRQLNGTIPSFLSEFPDLDSLDLHDNQLRGAVPFWYEKRWTWFDVRRNRLSGPVPSLLVKPGGRIALQGNAMEGYIPIEMSTLDQPECPFDSHLCVLQVPKACLSTTFTCHQTAGLQQNGDGMMVVAAIFPCLLVLVGILGTAYTLFWKKGRRVVPLPSEAVLSVDTTHSVSPTDPVSPLSTASSLQHVPSSTPSSTKWYQVKLEMGLDDVVQGLEVMKRQQERYRAVVEVSNVGYGFTPIREPAEPLSVPCLVHIPTTIKTPSLETMLLYRPGIPPPPVFQRQGPPTCPLPIPPQ
jgi:hypothetical protein